MNSHFAVPLEAVVWPELAKLGLNCSVLRLDLVSSSAPGNKYFKLFHNLQQAKAVDARAVMSFGGTWSNHLHALAVTGQKLGVPTIGVVRGHKDMPLTPMLQDAQKAGMQFIFVDRYSYRKREISDFLPILKAKYGEIFVIPEGGSNQSGVRGCIEIGRLLSNMQVSQGTTVCLPVGTGATFTGVLAGLRPGVEVLGISVLKGEDTLSAKVKYWLEQLGISGDDRSMRITHEYHHGGYGKAPAELLAWMLDFERNNHFQIDPVYTAKMFWAIEQLAKKGHWREGQHIVALHTGGVQGRRGYIKDGL